MARRIVVPLDRSELCESALPLARELAAQLNLPVTLVTAIDVPSQFARHAYGSGGQAQYPAADPVAPQTAYGRWHGFTTPAPTERQLERLAKQTGDAEQYLRDIATRFENTPVEVSVQLGRPAERILAVAAQRDNSYIVMASHGRSGFGRTLLGSVASRIVQGANAPVFVVNCAQGGPTTGPIERVLVPLDGSIFAEQALEAVDQLLGPLDVQLHLLYVIEGGESPDSYAQEVLEDYRDVSEQEAKDYLKWVAERLVTEGQRVSHEIAYGSAGDAIHWAANDRNADLIAMATHGRSGLARFVLGSVAERVLYHTSRPLMLVRPTFSDGNGRV
jgi:nucleotide-binding universal stress UspA family protein